MSPEAMQPAEKSDLRLIVESFYNALSARDADGVGAIIDESFAPEAILRRPESLPGGGAIDGAGKIKKFMAAVAAMEGGPMDVSSLKIHDVLEHAGEDGDSVVVELRFPFNGTQTSALEWWTVRDLKVVEIRAYYWDTAAMLGGAS
jgi:hypothetical protein